MKHEFELYLTSDQTTKEQWQHFYKTITTQLGMLAKCRIVVKIDDTIVRYFVESDRDLGRLSNNIEIGVLRPVTEGDLDIPANAGKESSVKYVTGGNVLDLAENMALKKAKKLRYAVFNLRYINATKSIVNLDLYFQDAANQWSANRKIITAFPAHLLAVDFATNTHYLRKSSPKYLSIEKTLQLFDPHPANALFSVSTFPYFPQDYYLPLTNYEFDKHSFIIGATGSGKSKLIQLIVERLMESQLRQNYRIIVVDPHDSLRHDLGSLPETRVVNFANESAELFGGDVQTDVSAATELTTSLMRSLLADQFNARLERVLRFSLFVLFVGQTMSLDFLKRFLTDLDLRNQVLEHVEGHVPDNIRQFFGTDFNEIRTTHYNDAILPIVSLVDEMQMQPTLVSENEQSLARLIQSNFLTVFSLNKVSMGDKVTKTVAGLLIQQIFLLAQARAFSQKVILIIDEVSVVQNPALASILAEARKFNLSVVLTQQYFGQVEKDLRDAIFANVYNYYSFRVSEEDAKSLAGNMNMDIPKEIIESEAAKGIKEEQIKINLLTSLDPRECLVRISANGQVLPCFKARTVDAKTVRKQADKILRAAPPKLKKFIEGQAHAKPTLKTKAPISPEPVKLPELEQQKLADDPLLKTEASPANFERMEAYETPMPVSAPMKRVIEKRDEAIAKLGGLVANAQSIPDPYMQSTTSLSEILASQSSSRIFKDK